MYGGTAGEMARLINETGVMGKAFVATAKNVKDVPFDKMIEAIHKVQEEMGIYGTTSLEAGETITGSMMAVKAQWENVLVALSDENQNLGDMIDILLGNLEVYLNNMMPKVVTALSKVPSFIEKVLPLLGQMIINLAPTLIQNSIALVKNIVTNTIPFVIDYAKNLITQFASTIQTNFSLVVGKAQELMAQFGEKIKDNMPSVISKALDMLMGFSQVVLENVPMLVAGGMDMIKNIVQGIINALPTLIQKAPQIITNFANTINRSATVILVKGAEIIWNLIKGIIGAIPDLIDNFPKVIEAIFAVWQAVNWVNLGKNLIGGIKDGIKNMSQSLKDTASNVFNNLKTNTANIFNNIKTAITSPILTAKTKALAVVGELQYAFMSIVKNLLSNIGKVFTSIKNAIVNPITSAKNIIKGILDTIKGFFSAFKITLPKIPLPHFSIKPKGWGFGDLLKGKIPELGIEWYKKAMDDGMVLNDPTIFGYQNGKFLGAGEAGSETVVGTGSLMGMIQQAVLESNARNEELIEKILLLLSSYIPQMANNNPQLVLDTGALVGALTPKIDKELGTISRMKLRGR